MVLGGADVYAQLMSVVTRLEITQIHARPDGEAVFPPIDPAVWRETARNAHAAGPGDDAGYETVTYVRARPAAEMHGRDPQRVERAEGVPYNPCRMMNRGSAVEPASQENFHALE